MGWTKEQQKVIGIRKKNVLVSAAAGSGKTAVLVERIISMITEEENPTDIDHLLVVTFTNAAAAQMREKIGNAIEKKLMAQPDNLHLQKQMTLLPGAMITTIHSFCLNVIRNYFNMIDLDPSFKMADEAEITLMKSDVVAEVLEQYYEEGREDFHAFIESYSHSKSDTPVEELILQLFHFSMSYPWPEQWLKEKQKAFEVSDLEDLNQTKWMKELLQYVKIVVADLYKRNEEALEICNDFDGPAAYVPAIESDRELLMQLLNINQYDKYYQAFSSLSFARLSSKKEEGVLPDKKEKVKSIREDIKKALKDVTGQYFFQEPQEMLQDLIGVKQVMAVLFELAQEFMKAFARKKEEKNIIDFNDLEHFALKILVEEREGEHHPSQAALELYEHFDEILIDEYQDSNLVQETLLKSISGERVGLPNRFMVGDVKQSIYKFRLAMPEIFMEKYATYAVEDFNEEGSPNLYQRIDLDKNFRSRAVVLHGVNAIFEQIMKQSVGGIDYNDEASLKPGADYDETEERAAKDIELLLVTEEELQMNSSDVDTQMEESDSSNGSVGEATVSEDEDELNYTKRELEARLIARRIKELINPDTGMLTYDTDRKCYTPATYRDIVILLRSMSNWSEVFVNILMQEGIPAYADTSTGYFHTIEISTILNLLRIIDNPRQDIPLAGVLYSPMVGLTGTQLSMIRASDRKAGMYQAIKTYLVEGSDEPLKVKLESFLNQLQSFRDKVNHTPIHELLLMVLDQTGYYYYASAMPAGDRRKANIDLLVSHAVRFEKSSYSGLFHFIRYIEKLHKYEVDFGEAVTVGEQDNTVRIMSIHKSKGLQFPIVFVGGLGKSFNTQDLRSKLVLHAEHGAGPEYINLENRTKVSTLLKKAIQKKVQIENLGEELRILYVALTRAKEKLIMTSYLKSVKECMQKELSYFDIVSAKSYLDWVLPSMLNKISSDGKEGKDIRADGMAIKIVQKSDFVKEEAGKQLFLQKDREELQAINPAEVYNAKFREEIKTRFEYHYPYKKEAGLKVKMSVSELKKLGQFVDEEQSEVLYHPSVKTSEVDLQKEKSIIATIPSFISQKETITGTDRGTLYHKVLELLDLTKVFGKEDVGEELHRMIVEQRLREEDISKLNINHINTFVQSDIAERMLRAQELGKLNKEQQFVIGLKASEVSEDFDSSELVLIQGIIDVFFEEEDELVLVDYKSDIVSDGQEELLQKRYKVQLEYYQKALEQMTSRKVKEKIIYSLYLGKEIRIK
ncbi:MAG: hypothetical protein K0S47_2362 [Herbinix sp.]|jgi:ATP-dependent helicase/nuclease subunit A|nr:hypothetical protein [Herbinix sp.]